jgi:Protein of unknown function (DUF2281)
MTPRLDMLLETEKLALIDAIIHVDNEAQLQQVREAVEPILYPKTSEKKLPRRAGWAKGIITYIADDFDAPLDDLKEYM